MRRRDWLALAAWTCSGSVAGGVFGCDRRHAGDPGSSSAAAPASDGGPPTPSAGGGAAESAPRGQGDPAPGAWEELDLGAGGDYPDPGRVAVRARPGAPLLVALHGAGENARGLVAGARGWRDDYALDRADARLRRPPLVRADFEEFVDDGRLGKLNASLAEEPYEGLAVACPFTPHIRDLGGARRWATWLEKVLLPAARRSAGVAADAPVGIDGVSMGGRLALLLGFARPDLFATVGASQPAITEEEAETTFADLALRAYRQRRRPLRLATSKGDFYLEAVRVLSRTLRRRGVDHQLVVTPGPHDYGWNRGPGSLEMQLWHDRALRGRRPA